MLAEVKFTVIIPAASSEQEARDWIEFQLGYSNRLPADNPLFHYGLVLVEPFPKVEIEFIQPQQLKIFRK